MPARLDHVAVPVRDAAAAARFLSEILLDAHVTRDGPDDEFHCVALAPDARVFFASTPSFEPLHMAFRVEPAEFDEVIARLRARRISFGNDPDQPDNGRTDDPLGGSGRVYFLDPDRHLFEVCA